MDSAHLLRHRHSIHRLYRIHANSLLVVAIPPVRLRALCLMDDDSILVSSVIGMAGKIPLDEIRWSKVVSENSPVFFRDDIRRIQHGGNLDINQLDSQSACAVLSVALIQKPIHRLINGNSNQTPDTSDDKFSEYQSEEERNSFAMCF